MGNFVLIAEDNPSDQMIIKAMVESEGFIAICANDGYEAVDLLDEFEFKLFIIDLQMPVLNGLELLKRIKSRKDFAEIPTVALSGRKEKVDVVTAIKCGAKDYIVKPITKKVFDEKLLPVLNERKAKWDDYYIDPKKQSDKANLSRPVRLTAINEFVATIQMGSPMSIGEEVIFSSEFTETCGVTDIKEKVIECNQGEEDTYAVKIEYRSLSTEQRKKLHVLFSESWVPSAEKHAKDKAG